MFSNIFRLFISAYEDKAKKAIVIMDCASWHTTEKLQIPENIQLQFLSPYCPELNPVEKFWQYVKNHTIKNKVFDTLQSIEDAICDFIMQIEAEKIRQICSVKNGQL